MSSTSSTKEILTASSGDILFYCRRRGNGIRNRLLHQYLSGLRIGGRSFQCVRPTDDLSFCVPCHVPDHRSIVVAVWIDLWSPDQVDQPSKGTAGSGFKNFGNERSNRSNRQIPTGNCLFLCRVAALYFFVVSGFAGVSGVYFILCDHLIQRPKADCNKVRSWVETLSGLKQSRDDNAKQHIQNVTEALKKRKALIRFWHSCLQKLHWLNNKRGTWLRDCLNLGTGYCTEQAWWRKFVD